MIGRDVDPWRGILAVALWLQEEHGVSGLFDRLEDLSVAYQSERADLETGDLTRLVILALQKMLGDEEAKEFETSALTVEVNRLASEADLGDDHFGVFTNVKRIGRQLQRLRFKKAQRTARHKRWQVTRDELSGLAQSYGLEVRTRRESGTNGNMAPSAVPSCQVCQVPEGSGTQQDSTVEELVTAVEQNLDALKAKIREGTAGQ